MQQPLGPNADLKVRYVLFVDYGQLHLVDTSHRLDLTDYNQDQGFQHSQNLALGIVLDRNRPK